MTRAVATAMATAMATPAALAVASMSLSSFQLCSKVRNGMVAFPAKGESREKWRCMSSVKEENYSERMPPRFAQKQKLLDELPGYEDLEAGAAHGAGARDGELCNEWRRGRAERNKVNTKVDMRFHVMKAD